MRIVIGIVIAVLIASSLFQTFRLHTEQRTNAELTESLATAQSYIAAKNKQLMAISAIAKENDIYQASMQQQLDALSQSETEKNQRIKDLINENAALKRWANTPLPADIIRMQQRPTITGAASYRAHLSSSNPLPTPRSQPENQR